MKQVTKTIKEYSKDYNESYNISLWQGINKNGNTKYVVRFEQTFQGPNKKRDAEEYYNKIKKINKINQQPTQEV